MPLKCELYRGNTRDGATFKAFVTSLQARYPGIEHVVVAATDMFSRKNLAAVEDADLQYINCALATITQTQTEALHAPGGRSLFDFRALAAVVKGRPRLFKRHGRMVASTVAALRGAVGKLRYTNEDTP